MAKLRQISNKEYIDILRIYSITVKSANSIIVNMHGHDEGITIPAPFAEDILKELHIDLAADKEKLKKKTNNQ